MILSPSAFISFDETPDYAQSVSRRERTERRLRNRRHMLHTSVIRERARLRASEAPTRIVAAFRVARGSVIPRADRTGGPFERDNTFEKI